MHSPADDLRYNFDSEISEGFQTATSGTMNFNTETSYGSLEIEPFEFLGSSFAIPHDIVMYAIGDGSNVDPGTLVAANMLFD